jgi:copper(I)-binding protein
VIRNSRRVVALAIAGAVAIAPVISACGAGETPQTAAPTQLTEGVNAHVPQDDKVSKIDIRNMFLLGPAPDQALPAGGSLPLYGTVINQVKGQQDRLVMVTSDAFSQVKITGGAVVLPAAQPSGQGSAVTLLGPAPTETPSAKPTGKPSGKPSTSASATPSATGTTSGATATPSTSTPASTAPGTTAPLIVLTGLNREVRGGETVRLRLQFEHAGSVELSVPVIPRQGEYTTYAPAPEASTPAPATSAGGTQASPTPTASGESESPSPSTTPSAG